MLIPTIIILLIQQASAVPEVIIIGAGASGLAAATKLFANNINVTVLEAESRIGGRVNSVPFGDAVVDLGAEWCHGEVGNVVYNMVKDLDVLRHSNFELNLHISDRRQLDKEFVSELRDLFDKIYSQSDVEPLEGITAGEYFIKEYNASVHRLYKNDPDKLDVSLATVEYFQHLTLSSEGAFSWFDVSALSDFKGSPGDFNLNWNGRGYKTALDVLMRKFPKKDPNFHIEKRIHLKKEVRNISWNETRAIISCSDGSVYSADHVIFTPSLGVLKHKHRTLFTPRLPYEKIEAVRHLGIGAVMKVMLRFPTRWWPKKDFTEFSFVWTLHHKEMLMAEFPHGPSKHGRSWILDFFSLYYLEKNPNALSAWFSGDMIPEIELIDDETLVDGIMFVMDRFLGHKFNISRPIEILRYKWYQNPHFRGTYTYQTIESRKQKPSSNEILSMPLYNPDNIPILLFAGEATHPHHYSTVHGAIETGHREADRILKYDHDKLMRV